MNLQTTVEGTTATIAVEGRLSVATSIELENEVSGLPETVNSFDFDLSGLEYISSAGLRVLVSTQKLATQRGGTMVLRNPTSEVYDVFEMTGLADIFTIEK